MRTNQAVAHFQSAAKLAEALGITKAAVSQWGEYVPELRAHQLEKLTDGKLSIQYPLAHQADGAAT